MPESSQFNKVKTTKYQEKALSPEALAAQELVKLGKEQVEQTKQEKEKINLLFEVLKEKFEKEVHAELLKQEIELKDIRDIKQRETIKINYKEKLIPIINIMLKEIDEIPRKDQQMKIEIGKIRNRLIATREYFEK